MRPSRAGRKRFFHEINEDTEGASLQSTDVKMVKMAPFVDGPSDAASQAAEVAEAQHALSSEGTMRESSRLSSTLTLVATDTGLEGGGVALKSDPADSSSTLAHDCIAPPSGSSNAQTSSPRCEPASPYTLPVTDCEPSDSPEDADHHSDAHPEDEAPPFGNYVNYCGYFDPTTIPLSDLNHSKIREVCERFEGAHSSYYENFITAYLAQTTFTVKVWINFDPSRPSKGLQWSSHKNFHGFYTDHRAEDTAELILAPKARRFIDSLHHNLLCFHHIRLDIGTPFRHLASMNLDFEIVEALDEFDFALSGRFSVDEDTVGGFKFLKSFLLVQAKQIEAWVK
ncbi:hypothetical protein LTR95_013280, partial [Oleoguttula sp. CCFEE 5521]